MIEKIPLCLLCVSVSLWWLLLPATAQEINVALAASGATVRADSEFLNSSFDTDGAAPASRLIDGILRGPHDEPGLNRWHSDLSAPHPHWAWVRFARPARIHRIVLWRADIGAPVDFAGQYTPDHRRSLKTLFTRKNVLLGAAHPSVAVEFPPVVADNFRLLITRSSNKEFPNYTQLSELQVFGEWAGEAPASRQKSAPARIRGTMEDAPLPEGLAVETTADSVTYQSRWLKVSFPLDRPGITFLSLDATGSGRLAKNLLKAPQGADMIAAGWDEQASSADSSFTISRAGNVVRYAGIRMGDMETDDLAFTVESKGLRVSIVRHIPAGYIATEVSPLRMLFDAAITPPSPMGRLKVRSELRFPVLLHFPDYGSLLVRAEAEEPLWSFTGRRGAREVQLSLQTGLKANKDGITMQRGGQFRTTLDMRLTEVYPEKALVDADPSLAGLKRGWLNIFQFRPDVACLSNNSLSDNVLFCVYEYADQAIFTPPLFDDFTALDLVRMTLDSYFDGTPGYGGDRDIFVDSDPAMVIAAWDVATGGESEGDILPVSEYFRSVKGKRRMWLQRRIEDIEKYADHILAADADGDGLAESKRTGISGSGINGAGEWSSNWWDVISFGWKDAYGNALDYRALRCMTDLERRLGRNDRAALYALRAAKIKAVYYRTFYNPETGILAGWRSKDGKLHDYGFTFVNGIACAYGLVTKEQGNALMDRMQAKFREVGYTNFRIGMPGNLVPVARKDYAGGGVLGEPHKDDGSDSFQSYENGGATGSFAYFYLQGLYALGRKEEADSILNAMLEGYRDGVFQNGVGSGVDWKRWDGTPCGYEGLLTDTYYALTAYLTGRLGKGVPMPRE
jgi:hypothetical protein